MIIATRYWHPTHATPCGSGPERPDDALCAAHGLMVSEADDRVWPNLMHTKVCLASAVISAIQNLRDEEGMSDFEFRIAMQNNVPLARADGYLTDGLSNCNC